MKDLEFPRMLYRVGTAWALESGRYDLLTVASIKEAEAARADGWHLDQYAARDAGSEPVKSPEPLTRAELEANAKALGLTWHHRTGDAKLAELIAAAEAG
jgi:hypothetical protein